MQKFYTDVNFLAKVRLGCFLAFAILDPVNDGFQWRVRQGRQTGHHPQNTRLRYKIDTSLNKRETIQLLSREVSLKSANNPRGSEIR